MFGAKTIARHAHLMNEMARVTGADLPGALVEGRITGEGLRSAVIRCTACSDAAGCSNWLAAHETGAEAPPGFCENLALFERLSKGV